MAEFTMPSLGADMDAGTLVEWLVKPGDRVKRGDVVAVVETQKGAIEIEVFASGVVAEIRVPVGAEVPVGTVLAVIDDGAAPVVAPTPPAAPVPSPVAPAPTPVAPAPPPVAPAPPRATPVAPAVPQGDWVRSSPTARRRAHELGVDLRKVTGTGPHGAVRREDVERAAATPAPALAPAPTPASPDRKAAMRAAIAAAMSRSNRDIPHYYLSTHIDVKKALDHLAALNRERPIEKRILPAALLIRAVAVALSEHPALNGFWEDGFRPATGVHPGIAINLRGGGLVIPALHDADKKDLDGVMASLQDLVIRSRAGKLRSGELADGTATITNLGDQGVETVFGVIYPPQVALIGLGRIVDRPWAVDGMLAVRPILNATLAGDHRATDGHVGGLFLARLDKILQTPESL